MDYRFKKFNEELAKKRAEEAAANKRLKNEEEQKKKLPIQLKLRMVKDRNDVDSTKVQEEKLNTIVPETILLNQIVPEGISSEGSVTSFEYSEEISYTQVPKTDHSRDPSDL
uniref:Uncharacterized protein n=1 Tax=Rhabditophanes sp. KR3021 TaxID=114890 RepID=A0AC35THT3_9BILA